MPLEIDKQVGDRITYKPFVGKVTAHSTYNVAGGKQRFAIEGVEDFWALHKDVLLSKPELGALPPVGTVARWTLQQSIVTGQYAGTPEKPKYYRDVINVEAVPQAEQSATPQATAEDAAYDNYVEKQVKPRPAGAIGLDDTVPAEWTMPLKYYRDRDLRMARQEVLRADASILAASVGKELSGFVADVSLRYQAVADLLAALPQPQAVAPEQAGTDVGDLPWSDEPKK